MNAEIDTIRVSGTPKFVRLGEYIALREADRIVTVDGKDHLVDGKVLRPVRFPWSRY